jgi:hypothetical protein
MSTSSFAFISATLGILLTSGVANADPPPSSTAPKMILELPILDATANLRSGRAIPSMAQTVAVSKSFNQASLFAIGRGVDYLISPQLRIINFLVKGIVKAPFVFLSVKLPGGTGWAHEEFHRAVMSRRNVDSTDEIYKFDLFGGTVSVSHVSDEALIAMKANHPQDLVRMNAAGYEAVHETVLAYQKDIFFRGVDSQALFCLLNTMNNVSYLSNAADGSYNERIKKSNAAEGTDITIRDFTGPDFTAWVYDLFRPLEPYAARGLHPSGVGISRPISNTQFTPDEQAYLSKQARLSWLSFIDPAMIGIARIHLPWIGNGNTEAMFNVKHHLTSFGDAINLNLFAQTPTTRGFAALTMYQNLTTTSPGLDLQVIDIPVNIGDTKILLNPRLMMWMQPDGQSFTTKRRQAGGLMSAAVAYPLSHGLKVTAELEGKTAGWVASHAALERELTARLGLSLVVN